MTWTPLLTAFTVLLAATTAAELYLDNLNRRYVRAHAGIVPEAMRGMSDADTCRRSADYTLAKNTFGQWRTLYDNTWLFAWLGLGLLPLAYARLADFFGGSIAGQAAVLCAVGLIMSVPGLPWDWASHFRLEARFGFNKSTLRLWVVDLFKGAALGLVLGYPLLCLILWFGKTFSQSWWLWAWAALMVFQLLMLILAPRVILPLFNKLSPLPEGDLRTRLFALADRTGFRCSAIEVMDGSRRSGHSNAFFTGFGRFRRIVLFDTLIAQMTTDEIEAVLAHEIGHYRLGHIPKMIAVSALTTLAGFAVLGWLARSPWFWEGFGFDAKAGLPAAILLFLVLAGPVGFWFSPAGNVLSRRHEYQADAYARRALGGPAHLVSALGKLHHENLSNPAPHPAYSFFHYSHPPLPERVAALEAGAA